MELRTLFAGEKITELGVYDLTMERYHGQPCVAPSVSGGNLRTIFWESPKDYWGYSSLNPRRREHKDKKAFAVGRGAHHIILGQEDFEREFIVVPSKWERGLYSDEAKAWRDYQIALGKTVLTQKDMADIKGMQESLAQEPMVQAGALGGEVERSLVWPDKNLGIYLKVRPDSIPQDSNDVTDLKTIDAVDDDSIKKAIGGMGYNVSAALTGTAFRRVLGRKMESFTLIFVQKRFPYSVRSVTLRDEDIAKGRDQLKVALKLFCKCLVTRQWPGPGGTTSDASFLGMMPYHERQIEDRIAQIEMEIQS